MAAKLIFAPEAEHDISEAYDWYEHQRFGLGEDFLSCVDACIQAICRRPEMYGIIYENYQRCLTRRFPYSIFYEFSNGIVTVYSVFHNSRDPQKWRDRLSL
ncbi:type II toxin-antitoxin system RelE/ParE family toxin [candidate division KSB1 bacterium]|nr:type II toxin-antitoxin system RelE/ParE family toxin [candidate division KSB1 bacterium]MBL7093504.1 type II toxin-antitoxin system RelE/ParE family toxin [candidate division KSB1 bacterium]